MPKEEIKKYIEFDHMYRCIVGGDKCLTVSEYGLGQHFIWHYFFIIFCCFLRVSILKCGLPIKKSLPNMTEKLLTGM